MTDYYVLHSGGLDSTTALAHCMRLPDMTSVTAVLINYGQRHIKELDYAKKIHRFYNVKCMTLDLQGYGKSVTSALTTTDIDVPDGEYDAENMKSTVVPGRNAVMLSAVAGLAASTSKGKTTVVTAVHSGDHHLYPDCRAEFIDSINTTLQLACDVSVSAPFVNMTKSDIVKYAGSMNVPLSLTWSCYKGLAVHCGTCGTCVERKQAFSHVGLQDDTVYLK